MGISERKERERRARRELFVDVAEKLFFSQGYEGTSVEQITRSAEFSKRTLYLYFEDKREVFLAVVLRGLEILDRALEETLQRSDDRSGADRLAELARSYFRFAMEHPDYFSAILSFESEEYRWGRDRDDVKENALACLQVNDRNTLRVHGVVRDGFADGSIQSVLDPAQFTLVIWAQMLGVVQVMAMRRDDLEPLYGLDPQAFFEAFIQMMRVGAAGSQSL